MSKMTEYEIQCVARRVCSEKGGEATVAEIRDACGLRSLSSVVAALEYNADFCVNVAIGIGGAGYAMLPKSQQIIECYTRV